MLSHSKPWQKLKATQTEDRNKKSLYDLRAPSYDSSWHPQFAGQLIKYLSDPPLSPGNRCLDLCCGTGLVTFLVAQQIVPGGRVYGVDISEGMLHVARAKQNSANVSLDKTSSLDGSELKELTEEERNCVELIRHDVEDLSGLQELAGLEQTFDLVSCASGLVLLRDARTALKSWAQWLKPGAGRMLLDVPHPLNLRSGAALEAAARKIGLELPFDRSWVESEDSLKDALHDTGILEVERMDFVQQQGWGKRWWNSDRETAEGKFSELMDGNILVVWAETLETATKDKLRDAFCEEWKNAADANGQLEEVDGTWVALARRK